VCWLDRVFCCFHFSSGDRLETGSTVGKLKHIKPKTRAANRSVGAARAAKETRCGHLACLDFISFHFFPDEGRLSGV
jgi:hypothetical protein